MTQRRHSSEVRVPRNGRSAPCDEPQHGAPGKLFCRTGHYVPGREVLQGVYYYGSGSNIGGLGLVFILGVAVIGLGIVIMIVQAIRRPAFFRGETLSLDAPASVRPKR